MIIDEALKIVEEYDAEREIVLAKDIVEAVGLLWGKTDKGTFRAPKKAYEELTELVQYDYVAHDYSYEERIFVAREIVDVYNGLIETEKNVQEFLASRYPEFLDKYPEYMDAWIVEFYDKSGKSKK